MKQKPKKSIVDNMAFTNLKEDMMTEEQFEKFMKSQTYNAMQICKAIREVKDEMTEIYTHFKNNS